MDEIRIIHAAGDEIESVLRLAFGHLEEPEHSLRTQAILRQFQAGKLDTEGLFQARRGDKRVGALFAQKRSDGTVFLWAPALLHGLSPEPFFEPLDRFCKKHDARAALAMVDRGQSFHRAAMRAAGFEALSDLLHLVAEVPELPSDKNLALEFVPMKADSQDDFRRMVRTVTETYRETRDFPRLLGILSVEGVLDGYRDTEEYRPEFWFFVRKDGRDVGALILTDFPETQTELTYMGLEPDIRGRGYAAELVRFAFDTAARLGREHLLTSVDEANTAALKTYLTRDFQAWDRKRIFVKLY